MANHSAVVLLRVVLVLVTAAGRRPALADDLGLLVDVEGILSEHLMPVSYLMLDGDPQAAGEVEGRMESDSAANGTELDPVLDASYSRALWTMRFHRNMINLYRCNGYLAKRILAEAYPVGKSSTAQLSKRMSSAHSNGNATLAAMMTDNSMLYDQGSAGYREWLTKTATLDDINQNYLSAAANPEAIGHGYQQRVAHGTTRVGEVAGAGPGEPEQELEFDEGVITGYAVQPAPVASNPYYPVLPDHPYRRELLQGEAASGYGRGDRGDYYYAGHPPALELDHKSLRKPAGSVGLKDLFDIALTTLAFLSFGMFILQVIMCITMTKPETGMMILPTQVPVEVDVDEGEVRHRAARHLVPGQGLSSAAGVHELNRIAAQALDSVDVMRTGDQCLERSLCSVNRFARTVKTIKFYWIPVWSLAVCWKAGDGQLTAFPSERPASSNVIMSCLIATLAGLGNDNCRKLYRCPHPTNGGQ
ncbi:uncharacterized protein LOC131213347 [Anopheles bellator]|uniref:uncharacterized protein LOC131213347 n=1 Tax=Anopheles bellator TaxID=139047 RepID=UPI002647CF0A|nr:uncharacterized protein LOC131213347 [Anopheles bellator]